MGMNQQTVDDAVAGALDSLFEYLDGGRTEGMSPSLLERMLDRSSYGLGDDYREWFELSGDPYE